MLPPVYIWVRTTVDWDDVDGLSGTLEPSFLPTRALWDATFTISYHVFRSELRRIAAWNHQNVVGATAAAWADIPGGALVVPVDDDDWFAPDLVEALAAHHDLDAVAYRWTGSYLEVPFNLAHSLHLARRRVVPRLPPRHYCMTNNYALVKRDESEPLAANHLLASNALRGSPDVRELRAVLSLMNRTLSSQTTLRPPTGFGRRRAEVTREHLVRRYRRYRSLYVEGARRAPAWSRPYVARMGELMETVELRDEPSGGVAGIQ